MDLIIAQQFVSGLYHTERRIAITGIANGGKTVFLTSLIHHLSEHDADEFRFGQRAQISEYREIQTPSNYGERFRYQAYRDRLARMGAWPEKTRDCLHYSCEFRRSDWKWRTSRLHLFDLPGERIADAAIAAMSDYAEWSDAILGHFADHSAYEEQAAPYLALLEKDYIKQEELIPEYKRTLGRLILKYKPLITPSTFLLDPHGRPAAGATAEELAQRQIAGLEPREEGGPRREFAPLSAAARERHPALTEYMAANYREYRRELVLPIFNELLRANRLIVLVDIPTLLAGGDGRFNDNRQILMDLFDALRPDSSLGGRILSALTFWTRPLDRIALVANKADIVHPSDIDNGRLEKLLRSMAQRASRSLRGVEIGWFVCSALVSTRAGSYDHTLIGRTVHNNPQRAEVEFHVSPLPEKWPPQWSPGQYSFVRVHPEFLQNHQFPPRQLGLDKIFDFISRE
jgi:predicted YcjX-like family ATPase